MSWETLGWYASIYFWLFFTGIGIPPCPEEAGILYAAGVSTLHPDVHWYLAWPLTSLGIISADVVLYGIGRLCGPRLFQVRWVSWVLKPKRRERLERRFEKHGIKLLIAARFLPPLRTGVFLIAGTIRYSFARFLLADGLFAVVGVGLFFFFGATLIHLLELARHWAVYIVAALVAAYGLYRYYRYLQRREAQMNPPPPPFSVLDLPLTAPAEGNGPTSTASGLSEPPSQRVFEQSKQT